MERLPPTEFGRALRLLIRKRFKTQVRYAEAADLDPTWLSKVIRSEGLNLSNQSFQALVTGFSEDADLRLLHEAFITSYVPLDSVKTPEPWSPDEQISLYASQVHVQISSGEIFSAFHIYKRLWTALSRNDNKGELALLIGRAYIEAANHLGRPLVGVKVAQEMEKIARKGREFVWVTIALWLEGISVRQAYPDKPMIAESVFRRLSDHLRDWQPLSQEERHSHRELSQTAIRDMALNTTDLVRTQQGEKGLLTRRVSILQDSIKESISKHVAGLGSEVAARSHILLSNFDSAEAALEAARKFSDEDSRPSELKNLMCELQLLLAIGEYDELWDKHWQALDLADQYSLVHYRQKLGEIEREIQRATASSPL